MKFSKKLNVVAIALILALTSSMQIKCDEIEKVKTNTAKIGYQHPYIPGAAVGLTVAKFLNAHVSKRFFAFSIVASVGTFLSQTISENYLKRTLNCFEWSTTKTPSFKAITDEYIQKFKSIFS